MITSRHVLSAAHCINYALYMVRLGEHDYRTDTEADHDDVRVVRSVPHSQYDKRLMINDIAILHLARDIHFNGKLHFFFIIPRIRISFAYLKFVSLFFSSQTASSPFVCHWKVVWHVKTLKAKIRSLLGKFHETGYFISYKINHFQSFVQLGNHTRKW